MEKKDNQNLEIKQKGFCQESSKESELTPRQWDLWRLIEYNSLVEHRKTSQREIYEKVSGYTWNDEKTAHDKCSAIWKDVKDNNESFEHDKIIISKNFEYWIGSSRETKQFLKDLWKALSPRLTRYWKFQDKLKLDQQGKVISNQGKPIDEDSLAKEFHECFNKYDIEMQKDEEDGTEQDLSR